MALTVEQLHDYINTNVRNNGRKAISGDVLGYLMNEFVIWVQTTTTNDVEDAIVNGVTDKSPSQNAVFDALANKQDTLVSGTSIKTLNGVSLLGSGNISISSGLTIGTTTITSGTVGRILFEGTGNVIQEDSGLFWDNTNKRAGIGSSSPTSRLTLATVGNLTNAVAFNIIDVVQGLDVFKVNGLGKVSIQFNDATDGFFFEPQLAEFYQKSYAGLKIHSITNSQGYFGYGVTAYKHGIGTNSPQARLDVRLQGSATGDIGLRLRNSSDSVNLLQITGDGGWIFRNNANSAYYYYDGAGTWEQQASSSKLTTTVAGYTTMVADGTTGIALGSVSHRAILYKNGNFQIEAASGILQTSGQGGISLKNGTAPSANTADRVTIFARDIVADNSVLNVRSENGDEQKIYSIGGWGTPTGTLTRTAFATYTGQTVSNPPTQAEVQAIDDYLKLLSERSAAVVYDLKTGHQLFKT